MDAGSLFDALCHLWTALSTSSADLPEVGLAGADLVGQLSTLRWVQQNVFDVHVSLSRMSVGGTLQHTVIDCQQHTAHTVQHHGQHEHK